MSPNPLPLYHKVYLLLRQRLESGEFEDDVAMPSENALAAEYDVSRLTVRRALHRLEGEGLVRRRQGSGTFPTVQSALISPQRSADIESLLAHLAKMGVETEVTLLEVGYEKPTMHVARKLELEDGMQVQRSVRVRRYGGRPFSYLAAYIPTDIAERFDADSLARQPLLEVLRSVGIQIESVEQTISALNAEPDIAQALEVPLGSAVLNVRRLVRDKHGRPVEYLWAAYRPDRYEYRMSLSAQESAGSKSWVHQSKPVPENYDRE